VPLRTTLAAPDPLVGCHSGDALAQFLLGEQPGLDPLGQLDLLLGVEQRDPADLLEVVLDRVGGRAGGRHLGGGKAFVVIAENQRLVLALLARCLRRAARSSGDAPLAGAWSLFTGCLLRGAGLNVGTALARHFDRSGRQRPADLNGVALPAGVGRVGQAHGSADTTTGSGSQPRPTSQPTSSCT